MQRSLQHSTPKQADGLNRWTGMPNSVMILVFLTVDPSWLANFPKKQTF
jgi:hypothetical protein